MRSRNVYLLLSLVFLTSVAATFVPSMGDLTRAVTALPAVGAVLAGLFQLLRDQMAHERAWSIQAAQNSFTVGVTSHMANVAFDKHVTFSEEYVVEMFQTLTTLFREGPTDQVLSHSGNLYKIRQRWAIWITPDVEIELEKFEAALRKIGASAHFVEVDLTSPKRSDTIETMYSLYEEVTGMTDGDEKQARADHAILSIIQCLRQVLGIEELTELRRTLVARSLHNAS